jgi:hypothetical protein
VVVASQQRALTGDSQAPQDSLAAPRFHCSFVYTAEDRHLAISQASRISTWVGFLHGLEGLLALGLIADLWARGFSAKADLGFLLLGMLLCAALLLYEHLSTHWIEPGGRSR